MYPKAPFSSALLDHYSGDAQGASWEYRGGQISDTRLRRAAIHSLEAKFTEQQEDRVGSRSLLKLSPLNQPLTPNINNIFSDKQGVKQYEPTALRQVLFKESMHEPPNVHQEKDATNSLSDTTGQTKHNSLLSPIMLTPPSVANDMSDSISESENEPPRDTPPAGADKNRCAFPPYVEQTNSSIGWDVAGQESSILPRSRTPNRRRSLSVGGGFPESSNDKAEANLEENNTLMDRRRGTLRSREPRHSPGSLSLKKTRTPWVEQIVEATNRAGSYQPTGSTKGSENHFRCRPRLWLDAMSEDKGVAKAHMTTLTPSPTKPRVISIPRRTSSVSSPKPASPNSGHEQHTWFRTDEPVTPPVTPCGSLGLCSSSNKLFGADDRTSHLAKQTPGIGYPYTPPNSRVSTPQARSTIRHVTIIPSIDPKSQVSRSSIHVSSICSDQADLIMGELEVAIHNYPSARLYLDSPIIQYLRLLCSVYPGPQCNVPKTPFSAAPHSRYSVFKQPSPSHQVPSPLTSSCRSTPVCSFAHVDQAPSNGDSTPIWTSSPALHKNPTLSALHMIFPLAPAPLLDSLQATYLALNYILSLRDATVSPSIERLSTTQPSRPSTPSFSSIPPKALATLGMQMPLNSTAGISRRHCATSSAREDADSTNRHILQRRERRENLRINLKILVRGLLGEIESRRLTKKDESLVRAVGEVVRCGENAVGGR